jgi:hypothetical protein
MIELAFHCLVFADNVRYEFKRDYYEILSQIFMRDELKLTNVALGPELEERRSRELTRYKEQKSKKNIGAADNDLLLSAGSDPEVNLDRLKQDKIKIAQFYQKLLYQTLDDCLIKFCRKDVEPYLRSYLEICISIAFFRVPRF